MKRGTARHYKIFDLADALGIENYAALGLMASLWDWAAETKPAGDVGAATNRTLARAAGWIGDADTLIGAMVKAKLLDEHSVCRLMIHDWPEHCDDGVHTYMARRRMLFADGSAPRLRHLHSREREAAEAEYTAILTQKPVPPQGLDTPAECPRNVQGQNAVGTERIGSVRYETVRDGDGAPTPSGGAFSDSIEPDPDATWMIRSVAKAVGYQLSSSQQYAITDLQAQLVLVPHPVIGGKPTHWRDVFEAACVQALQTAQNKSPVPFAKYAITFAKGAITDGKMPGAKANESTSVSSSEIDDILAKGK